MYGTKIRTDADDSSMEGVYKDGKCREKEVGLAACFLIFLLLMGISFTALAAPQAGLNKNKA